MVNINITEFLVYSMLERSRLKSQVTGTTEEGIAKVWALILEGGGGKGEHCPIQLLFP